MKRLGTTSAILTAVTLALAGCASDGRPDTRPAAARVDPESLLAAFAGTSFDYAEFDPITRMAGVDEITDIVRGKVWGLEAAPALVDDAGSPVTQMQVTVTESLKGSAEPGSILYVTLPVEMVPAMRDALPKDSEVAFYLSPVTQEGQKSSNLMPVSPQGFMVAEDDGTGVVWPMAGAHRAESTLEQQLPANTSPMVDQ